MTRRGWLMVTGAPLVALLLQGCIEMAVVGAGAAVVSVENRRTTGAQFEDESIELRAANRIRERFGDKAHINVTSYNRAVLLTGEAPEERIKAEAEKIVLGLANVRGVTNEIQIEGSSSLGSRSNDGFITSKVKARFVDASRFNVLHVKVVTESGIVYLLGIVTEKEADAAVEIARTTGGVRKVVKIFEYCQPTDEICRPRPAPKGEESTPKS
jgi:osmotically-inducible protein OsmY